MACPSELFAEKVSQEQLLTVDDFTDDLVCKICLVNVVGCGPKLTKCSHLFCGDCLEQWFAQHPGNQTWAQRAKSGGVVPCPVCKTELKNDGGDSYAVEKDGNEGSALLWRMLSTLRVQCCQPCAGERGVCQWAGDYGEYWQHVHGGGCGLEESVEPMKQVRSDSLDECTSDVPTTPPLSSRSDSSTADDEEMCVDTSRSPTPRKRVSWGWVDFFSFESEKVELSEPETEVSLDEDTMSHTAVSPRSPLSLVDCITGSSKAQQQFRAPASPPNNSISFGATQVAHAAQCQAHVARQWQVLQLQQTARVIQWQRASMAYAGQMAQYQMAAAYGAQLQQATRYQNAVRLQASRTA